MEAHIPSTKQIRGVDGGLAWPLEVQRRAMGGIAAFMLAGSCVGDAAMDPEVGAMLSSGHADLLATKVCVLPDDDSNSLRVSAGEGGDLPRQSSLGQLRLDILPNHSLVEFFKHRDSREAKEASCLASSSFEEESRGPSATRRVVEQGARNARGAREIDFQLETDIRLQASSEIGEKLGVRFGIRRAQQRAPRGRSFLRTRSRRGLQPHPPAESDPGHEAAEGLSTASPVRSSNPPRAGITRTASSLGNNILPIKPLHKMARTRSALV